MNNNKYLKLKKSIITSVIKTLEDMAFMEVVPLPDIPEKLDYNQIVHISLYKPELGEIFLFMPYPCKKMIVENIYSRDWTSLEQAIIDDCLLELLNILAGNFMDLYYGQNTTHNVSFSEMFFDDSDISDYNTLYDFYFSAEGCPFRVAIFFQHS